MLTRFFWAVAVLSLESSLVAAAILLARALLWRRIPAGLQYGIWLILVVRLLFPVLPASPVGLFPSFASASGTSESGTSASGATAYKPAAAYTAAAVSAGQKTPSEVGSAAARHTVAPKTSHIPDGQTVALIWLSGCGGVCACLLAAGLAARRKISKYEKCRDERVAGALHACRATLGMKREPEVIVAPGLCSPAAAGIFRPKIILPAAIAEELSDRELYYILLHESVHIRRRDNALSLLTLLLRAVNWFNPLLWVSFAAMKHDCEIACDAKVLSLLNTGEQRAYGEAIVGMLERISSPVLPGFSGFAGKTGRFYKRRIHMIVHNNRFAAPFAAAVCVLALLAGCASLPAANRAPGGQAVPNGRSAAAASSRDVSSSSPASAPQSARAVSQTPLSVAKVYGSLDDFAAKNGYTILVDSGRTGTLRLPDNFSAVSKGEKVGEYLAACNAFSAKYGLDFSGYLGQNLTLNDFDTTKGEKSFYLFGLYDGEKLVGVWADEHSPASNDKRGTKTFGGLYAEG